jgi:hypothetical protein
MKALREQPEDPLNRVSVGVRADLQRLVVVDRLSFGHEALNKGSRMSLGDG